MRVRSGSQMANSVKVFRLNPFSWWAGYDFASVKSAYLLETGVGNTEIFNEEELPKNAMNAVRIYANPFAKESNTFQEELARMVAEGQEFPCYFAGRYTTGSACSLSAATTEVWT
jgi:hypothetical protein